MRKPAEPSDAELELLIDIAEGRFLNYYLLSKGQKFLATALQQRGLIDTGKKDHRVPLALTDKGWTVAATSKVRIGDSR